MTTDDSHVHFHCYNDGLGDISGFMLAKQRKNGKLHLRKKKRIRFCLCQQQVYTCEYESSAGTRSGTQLIQLVQTVGVAVQHAQAADRYLIIRRDRDIGKETGTLLSPNDRKLGDEYPADIVLTVYKITGNADKGWSGQQLWIPNPDKPE